jgi:hypothetical protein
VEGLIEEERRRDWAQQMHYSGYDTFSNSLQGQSSNNNVPGNGDVREGLRMYRLPRPSCATPMERFATWSPVNDPQPWVAKEEMQKHDIGFGAMETADLRLAAAKTSTAQVKQDDNLTNLPSEFDLSSEPDLLSLTSTDWKAIVAQHRHESTGLESRCRIYKSKRQRRAANSVDKKRSTGSSNSR